MSQWKIGIIWVNSSFPMNASGTLEILSIFCSWQFSAKSRCGLPLHLQDIVTWNTLLLTRCLDQSTFFFFFFFDFVSSILSSAISSCSCSSFRFLFLLLCISSLLLSSWKSKYFTCQLNTLALQYFITNLLKGFPNVPSSQRWRQVLVAFKTAPCYTRRQHRCFLFCFTNGAIFIKTKIN